MLTKLIGIFTLVAIMGTWGCAGRNLTRTQGIPDVADQLLKGKREIYFEGILHRDIQGVIYILIKGRPDLFPSVAGLTVCIGGICKSESVAVQRLRYFKLIVPPVTYNHPSLIPVSVGLRHIKGINPITGYHVYEIEPFVERQLRLEYRPTVAKERRLMPIGFCRGVCKSAESQPRVWGQ